MGRPPPGDRAGAGAGGGILTLQMMRQIGMRKLNCLSVEGGEFPPISLLMGLGAWGPPAVFLPAWGTVDLALECDLVIKREKDYKFERAHDEAKMSRHRKFGREQKADGWWYDKPWIPAVKSVCPSSTLQLSRALISHSNLGSSAESSTVHYQTMCPWASYSPLCSSFHFCWLRSQKGEVCVCRPGGSLEELKPGHQRAEPCVHRTGVCHVSQSTAWVWKLS